MPRSRTSRNGPFSFLTEKRETYRRDVAGERADWKRAKQRTAADEKARKREAAETAADIQTSFAYNTGARHKSEGKKPRPVAALASASKALGPAKATALAKREYMRGYRSNPAQSGAQYRLAQAVLSGTNKVAGMSKKAAREIVDATPARLRSLFSKQNPEDSAAELSEAWHGRPPKTATDIIERVHYHGVLTELGQLEEIKVMVTTRKAQAIRFDDDTFLCSSENGKQLYVVGGDQSLDLEALGIEGEEAEKDCVMVGEVYSLTYVTDKQHLGKADKQTGPYEHVMGEDGGVPPFLVYDRLNSSIGFAGGTYRIDPTDYDGSHSAGIKN